MTIAEDMKKLTENIIISNDVRLKTMGELIADTHETLKGFATERKKMASDQAKDLAGFVNGLSKNVKHLLKDAQQMVAEFHKSNKQMSREQAKKLADFVKDLTKNVDSMLTGFRNNRGEMSKELKNKLAGEIKDIQSDVGKILHEADKFIGEFSSDMAGAKKAWKSMSATLAKARKAGLGPRKAGTRFVMPEIEAEERVTTVGQAIGKGKKKKGKTA
jgi:ElaB/YqjD/DUF883 family membrane-anchored ribosome-binding protein